MGINKKIENEKECLRTKKSEQRIGTQQRDERQKDNKEMGK